MLTAPPPRALPDTDPPPGTTRERWRVLQAIAATGVEVERAEQRLLVTAPGSSEHLAAVKVVEGLQRELLHHHQALDLYDWLIRARLALTADIDRRQKEIGDLLGKGQEEELNRCVRRLRWKLAVLTRVNRVLLTYQA